MPTPRRRGSVRKDQLFRLAAAVIFAAASIFRIVSVHAIGATDRRFASSRFGVSVEAPAGWTLSQHTGYADTLVLLLHPDGSRISVTVATTTAQTAAELYEQNRPGFAAQGLLPSPLGTGVRGSFAVELSAHARPDKLRQLYLVREVPRGHQAIILTLVCRAGSLAARAAALDFVASRMGLDDPLAPSGGARGGASPSGVGGKSGR